VLVAPLGTRAAGVAPIPVRNEAQFAAAVSAFRDSGGKVMLLPHVYRGELVVPPRTGRLLRIVGERGVRIEGMLLDHAQRVSVGGLVLAPVTHDARIEIDASSHIELHDIVVTAAGTRLTASVVVPDSSDVTIRHSEFTHCGDRSPSWSNCLQLKQWAKHVTVADSWFHDCYGCDFVHGRFGTGLVLERNRFERALPCRINPVRCGHQDLIELFAGRRLLVEANVFGVYEIGGAQLYLTNGIDHVRIVNNVFLGTDPRVPGYRARVALIIGSAGSERVPHDVTVVNNTILTGAARADGYAGSIRMSSLYGGVPRRERPIPANNVIGLLQVPAHVCSEVRLSIANVVLHGHLCSYSDRVGSAHLDSRGRPTAGSTLLIDRASRSYAPPTDLTGRARGAPPDIGAFEYRGAKH
jgi:hypothetical protein